MAEGIKAEGRPGLYRYFDLVIQSTVELAELQQAAAGPADVQIARSFMLDIEDQQAVSRLFRTACAVHAACPWIWSLGYRRDYGVLEDVLEAVADPDQFLTGAKRKVP